MISEDTDSEIPITKPECAKYIVIISSNPPAVSDL